MRRYQAPFTYRSYCHCFPVMWSLTTPFCTWTVRRLSPRIPLPICRLRSSLMLPFRSSSKRCFSFARRIRSASARFRNWERSVSQRTYRPDGLWRSCTQDSTLLTFCPPLPPLLVNDHSKSPSRKGISASLTSAKTATVTVEVWTLPRFSVGGTRCHLCPPPSSLNMSVSGTVNTAIPGRLSTISKLKTPPQGNAAINRKLIFNEEFGVFASLARPDFNDWHIENL